MRLQAAQLGWANQHGGAARDNGLGGARANARADTAGAGAGRWTRSAAFTKRGSFELWNLCGFGMKLEAR